MLPNHPASEWQSWDLNLGFSKFKKQTLGVSPPPSPQFTITKTVGASTAEYRQPFGAACLHPLLSLTQGLPAESQWEPGAQSVEAGPRDWGEEGRRVPPAPACRGRPPALCAAGLPVPVSVPSPGARLPAPRGSSAFPPGGGGRTQGPSSQVEPKSHAGWQSCWERLGEPSLPLPAEPGE